MFCASLLTNTFLKTVFKFLNAVSFLYKQINVIMHIHTHVSHTHMNDTLMQSFQIIRQAESPGISRRQDFHHHYYPFSNHSAVFRMKHFVTVLVFCFSVKLLLLSTMTFGLNKPIYSFAIFLIKPHQ